MTFLMLIVASLCSFWLAGEIQTKGETLITWACYGLSASFLARGFLEAYFITIGKEE